MPSLHHAARRLSLVMALACGCAGAGPAPEQIPTKPTASMDKPPTREIPAAPPNEVEAEALRCDGAALMARGADALAALDLDTSPPSAALLARWEQARAFDGDGRLVAASVDDMLPRFAAALGMAPPSWWVDTLRSARRVDDATAYDLGLTQEGDRRGALRAGPGGVRVRAGQPLVESGGMLAYDLSMGRVALGPIPSNPGTAIEVTRARAGSTLYVALFEPASGGVRFPLRAVGSDGQELWSTEVCAADRKALGGLGSMIVESVVLEDPPVNPRVKANSNPRALVVFTAESHGVTVEAFELKTGVRTLAWSSDLWSWRG